MKTRDQAAEAKEGAAEAEAELAKSEDERRRLQRELDRTHKADPPSPVRPTDPPRRRLPAGVTLSVGGVLVFAMVEFGALNRRRNSAPPNPDRTLVALDNTAR